MDDSRSAVCFCYHRVEWLTALNAWCVVEQLQVWCRQRKTSWRRWSEEVIRAAHHLTEHLHLGKLTQSLYYLVATRYSTPLCSLFLLLHISSLPTPSCIWSTPPRTSCGQMSTTTWLFTPISICRCGWPTCWPPPTTQSTLRCTAWVGRCSDVESDACADRPHTGSCTAKAPNMTHPRHAYSWPRHTLLEVLVSARDTRKHHRAPAMVFCRHGHGDSEFGSDFVAEFVVFFLRRASFECPRRR